jgi:hypothetical protein
MKELPVPFCPQTGGTDRAFAALEMILKFKAPGRNDINGLIRGAIAQANHRFSAGIDLQQGVAPKAIGDILALIGFSTGQRSYPKAVLSFDEIKKVIDGNFPILAYLQNGLQGQYGHYIVINGYGNDANAGSRQYIILHDPRGQKSKAVYLDLFPAQYFSQGNWIWGESWTI